MKIAQKIEPCLWYDGKAEEAARAMGAMMQMVKFDVAELKKAYEGYE